MEDVHQLHKPKQNSPQRLVRLPSIDRLVDGASKFFILDFLDAYLEYNQILIFKWEKEKTAFIADMASYSYLVMSFSLKNAGATNQRLMDKIFKNQLRRNLEIYVDNIVFKSTIALSHAKYLA